MSLENVRRFFDAVKEDSETIAQLRQATAVPAFTELAVRLGTERSFAFTAQDVERLLAEATATGRALADEDLEAVAGGTYSGPRSPHLQAYLGAGSTLTWVGRGGCGGTGGCQLE